MPLFASQLSINTQHESSWDTYIWDSNATTNYADSNQIKCNANVGRGGTTIQRAILAFDLSDLANRNITSCTLTMKTMAGFGLSGTNDSRISLLNVDDANIVYDEVTWNESKSGTSWSTAGGDFAPQVGTYDIGWPRAGNETFTSDDLTNLIKNKAGGMAFVIIKVPDESTGSFNKAVQGHDEDDSSVVSDLPTLSITSTTDHRNVFKRREMTKYMNKAVGIKGKASVPSLG